MNCLGRLPSEAIYYQILRGKEQRKYCRGNTEHLKRWLFSATVLLCDSCLLHVL